MTLLLVLTLIGQPPLSARPDSLAPAPRCSTGAAVANPHPSVTRPLDHLTTRPHSDPDRWFAMDKFWHFSASFVTVGAAYHLGANRLNMSSPWPTGLAMGGTLTLGVTKELSDLAGPSKHFSWKDLVADAAGIGVGYFAFIHHF